MRALLNTLYIVTPECRLSKDGDCIKILKGKDELGTFPLNILENIVCFTYSGPSPQIMDACAKCGIPLNIMSSSGRFIASVQGPVRGNVLLRREQYRRADNTDFCITFSKNIIWGKIFNSIRLIQRGLNDHGDKINSELLRASITHMKSALDRISEANSMDELRGIEGDAAKVYFDSFDELILRDKNTFKLAQRNRRPPLDPANALLSFLYSVLANEVKSSLEAAGLDPYVGFLHTDRPGRPSLALDLMEELRSPMVDRLVLKAINLRIIDSSDFHTEEAGACLLTPGGRDKIIALWQEEKRITTLHGYISEKVEWGLIPHVQSTLLSRHLRSDIDLYPPFLV